MVFINYIIIFENRYLCWSSPTPIKKLIASQQLSCGSLPNLKHYLLEDDLKSIQFSLLNNWYFFIWTKFETLATQWKIISGENNIYGRWVWKLKVKFDQRLLNEFKGKIYSKTWEEILSVDLLSWACYPLLSFNLSFVQYLS